MLRALDIRDMLIIDRLDLDSKKPLTMHNILYLQGLEKKISRFMKIILFLNHLRRNGGLPPYGVKL